MELRVVVGVDVDESGCHEQTVGVDHPRGALVEPTDRGDPPVADRDVGGARRRARAVDDRPAADQEVKLRCHRGRTR